MYDNLTLIAFQIFYLFEKNNLELLLPLEQKNLESVTHTKKRLLLQEIMNAAQEKYFIDANLDLWGFIKVIRKPFLEVFNARKKALEKAEYSQDFKFPYPKNEFLLVGKFIITQKMIKEETPSPKEFLAPGVVRLVGVEVDHDNNDIWTNARDASSHTGSETSHFT